MVGPILPGPPQPLPEDLEEFMMGSGEDGVIVVSFGTIVSTLDDETLRVMVKALSSLSQRVIWKLKTGTFVKPPADLVSALIIHKV